MLNTGVLKDTKLTTLKMKRVGVAQNDLFCDLVHLGSKNLGS